VLLWMQFNAETAILTFGGLPAPFLPMRAKVGVLEYTYGLRSHAKFRFDHCILSPSGGEKLQIFCRFWTSAFCGVAFASWRQSEKDEHGCTTANLPLSNGIKTVSILQRLHGEIVRRICVSQKRDGQTDRQTDRQTNKKPNILGRPGDG